MKRSILAAGAFCAGPGTSAGTAARFTKPLGFQLYTLRQVFDKNPEELFEKLARAGYREVEVLRNGFEQMVPLLSKAGLEPTSGHFDTALVTGNWDKWKQRAGYVPPPEGYDWNKAVAQAHGAGLKFMVIPFLLPAERGSLDEYRQFADRLNRAGESCRAAGMRLCYHHHSFEFKPQEGSRPFDVLIERLDPKLVGIEADVFWASVGGEDPAALLSKLKGRVPLIHLKDKAAATPTEFDELKVARSAFKEIGTGVLDIPAILRAAAASGVEHYYVEQDWSPGDPTASLLRSFANLEAVVV
jgi:sugar phosphate isomerase/epimerase